MNDDIFKNFSVRLLFICIFFFVPLVFFTNLTRNPYYFQIALLNILVISFSAYLITCFIKNKKIYLPFNIGVKLFIIMLGVYFISSLHSYFAHGEFFKDSIMSEFRRIWFFTIINAFIPFLIAHYLSYDNESELNYSFVFIILWGSLWFLFPFVKVDFIFFDPYGFLLWLIAILYICVKTKKINEDNLLKIAMLAGFFASVYGVMQYFGIEIIWPKILNPYGRRAVSTFGNPNFVSSYVLMLIPISIYYLIISKSIQSRILYSLFLLSYFSMIFASLTRSSLIGLFSIVFFVSLFKDYRNFIGLNLKKVKKVLIFIFLILLLWPDQNLKPLSFGVVNRIYEGVKNSAGKFSLDVEKKDIYPSFHQRLLIWSCGYLMFKEDPIIGKGWGSFELFYPFYQGHMLRMYPSINSLRTHANNAHNEIVEILSQTGIVGFGVSFLFIFSFFYFFIKNFSSYLPDKRIYIITLLSSVIGMIVDNLLNVSIHFAVPGFLFFFILGILSKEIFQSHILEIVLKLKIKYLLFIFLLIIIFLIKYCFFSFVREVYYFKGLKYARGGNLNLAIENLEKAYKYNSREVNNNYELANAYAQTQQNEKAIFMYKEALKSNAGYDEIFFNLGVVEKKTGKYFEALKNFRTALWINPLNEKAYYAVGEIILNHYPDKLDELIYILEDGVKIHNYNSYIYYLLGYSYEKKGNILRAIENYKNAILNNPFNRLYLENYIRLNKKIEREIEVLLKLYEDFIFKDKSEINDISEKLLFLKNEFKENLGVMFLEAKYLYETKEYKKAIEILKELKEKNLNFPYINLLLGMSYEKIEKYSDALIEYENYLRYKPDDKNIREKVNNLKIKK